MHLPLFPATWQVLDTETDGSRLILHVQDQRHEACCPHCQQASSHLHSWYVRHPQDTALGNLAVRLFLHARRFRCLNPSCDCVTFSETWPGWLEPHAQRTQRLSQAQCQVGLSLGGEAGHRLLLQIHEPTSADTLLRLIRKIPLPSFTTPRVLGVDDFCLRRRKTYGTILIDLERHEVIDLLKDRKENILSDWLKAHPGVEIISRDRAGEYARGAASDAPDAQQIADRFHLIGNIREAVTSWLRQQRPQPVIADKSLPTVAPIPPDHSEKPTTERERIQVSVAKREQRQAKYKQAVELYAKGQSFKAIARQVGAARSTVTEWLRREGPLVRRTPPSGLSPYVAYINTRIAEPEWTITQIYHEIVQQGYQGAFSNVTRYITWLRVGQQIPSIADQSHAVPREKRLNAVHTAWLVTMKPSQRSEAESTKLDTVLEKIPQGQGIYRLVQDLLGWLREAPRSGAPLLTSWIEQAESTGIIAIQRLARGLQKDFDAVCGAIESPWSNGQTEGQVNRLKMIKRQMFGRAKFDLLRQRVLLA